MVIVAPSGVLVAAVLLALFLRSPFCVDIVSDVSLFWRAAIRTLVAQISNRRARTGLLKDRLHCASLVAAYAQFHASLELQQFQPVGPRQGLEKCPCPLLNEPCLAHRSATPMQDRCIRLVLKEPAETVAFEQRTQHLQFLAGGCRRRLQLTSTIGEEALSSVQTPDFKGWVNAQQRSNLMRGAARDDCHARSPLLLDARQQLTHPGPGPRQKAIHAKRRQRAIVIQQQKRSDFAGKASEERSYLFHRRDCPRMPASCIRSVSGYSVGAEDSGWAWIGSVVPELSMRNSRRSPRMLAAQR